MAIEQNITPYSQYFTGEDKSLPCVIYQSDLSTRQNLTGWAGVSWMVKEDPEDDDADALITKTLTDGITVTDAAQGELTIELDDEDIAALDAETNYYHELRRTEAPKTVLIFGRLQLSQGVQA